MIHLKKRNNHESNLEKEECAHQICSTFNIFIKEKMNQEYIFENNNQEKKEWAHPIAHLTISLKKSKIMNIPFKKSMERNKDENTE